MKRFISFTLVVILLLSMTACKQEEPAIDPVLAERRDIAEQYMRSMLTVLWSPEEDILYTLDNKLSPEESGSKQMLLKADRTYQGMPYSFAGSTLTAFLEYASKQDDAGVYTISDLHWRALSRNSNIARIGLDGSSALMLSWAQIGYSFTFTSSNTMTEENGYLRVGTYTSPNDTSEDSNQICYENGTDTMYASYAQLQKADGVFTSIDTGAHTMMVVETQVVKNDDDTINENESYVITLEQSKYPFLEEAHSFNEELGSEVYNISSIDKKHTFKELYDNGYLPITCKELIDPAPLSEVSLNDSNASSNAENFLNGFIDTNYHIDTVTVSIYDAENNLLQQAALRATRYEKRILSLNNFSKENANTIRGSFDYSALPSGNYRATLVCRLVNGQEIMTRDLSFEKEG